MPEKRQNKILNIIINEHIKEAQPVGSGAIAKKYGLKLSSATIRHEMKDLEDKGYIYQPYTSAGRVPTEKGWKYYLENFLSEKKISDQEKKELEHSFNIKSDDKKQNVKNLAKKLAEISRETVIVGFSPEYTYYTGLSHLFRQPEFEEYELICHISEVIDHLDEVIIRLFKNTEKDDFKILIGQENPFGENCGAIISKYEDKNGQEGIFTLLGPRRMSYAQNLSRLKHSHSLLKTI
ncbi:MAG: winged-helix domain-containing protein [Patescibacteria group bacterium]|nr:winged-helix domain-containing protein [Patescibacteria group bacterium]